MSLTLPSALDLAIVGRAPLFAELDRPRLEALLEGSRVLALPEGGLVFNRGDPADRFFVVIAGRVHLQALSAAGEATIIEMVEPGYSFAEAAIFASGRFPLMAEAAPLSRLLMVPGPVFLKRLADQPDLTARLLAALALWQRRLIAEAADLKLKSPAQRLGLFLLGLAEDRAAGHVVLPISKRDLASRLGIAPESLSRALSRLKSFGVSSEGREFRIEDSDGLRKFCGSD